MVGGKRNRWNVERKTTGEGGLVGWGGGFRENDIVIHSTLCHKLGLKDAKTSSALSPVGEMAQFKQSKQLFYSDSHFSLAGG